MCFSVHLAHGITTDVNWKPRHHRPLPDALFRSEIGTLTPLDFLFRHVVNSNIFCASTSDNDASINEKNTQLTGGVGAHL